MNRSKKQLNPRGGVKAAAEILNGLDPESRSRLLRSLRERDSSLADQLRQQMFTFEDVFRLDDPLIRKIIHATPARTLTLALRGAHEEILAATFKNMSTRAAEVLREDIEALGPQRRGDVDAARAEVVGVARRFHEFE